MPNQQNHQLVNGYLVSMSDKSYSINLTRMWRAQDAESIGSPDNPFENDSTGPNRWIELTNLSDRAFDRPIQLIRYFNRPTGLNADSRCELVFENLPAGTFCHLNGHNLGTINDVTCRFKISQFLQATNRILIELQLERDSTAVSVRAVRLEIL